MALKHWIDCPGWRNLCCESTWIVSCSNSGEKSPGSGQLGRVPKRSRNIRTSESFWFWWRAAHECANTEQSGGSPFNSWRGQVRIHLADRKVNVAAGHLLVLDCGVLHDVEALEESALLLTISTWRRGFVANGWWRWRPWRCGEPARRGREGRSCQLDVFYEFFRKRLF